MFLNYWYEEAVAQEMFCKKDILKNVAEFTRKHLNQLSFFNKVADGAIRSLKFLHRDDYRWKWIEKAIKWEKC